jgi:hypothetical protein
VLGCQWYQPNDWEIFGVLEKMAVSVDDDDGKNNDDDDDDDFREPRRQSAMRDGHFSFLYADET